MKNLKLKDVLFGLGFTFTAAGGGMLGVLIYLGAIAGYKKLTKQVKVYE